MPEPSQDEARVGDARCILLLCDNWSATAEGIVAVNQSLALALARYKGIRVLCTIFKSLNDLSPEDRALAEQNNITLISLASQSTSSKELYPTLNEDPINLFQQAGAQLPEVSHIVGHSPITAEAALNLRESAYPEAKVILFYHVIPRDVEWLAEKLPYVVPTDSEQVRLGEQADVVYSVTEKQHWYYTAKFRNRAKVQVDHRLFLPQATDGTFELKRKETESRSGSSILTTRLESPAQAQWSGIDISTCAVNKVALASGEQSENEPGSFKVKIGGVPADKSPMVRAHLEQYANAPNMTVDLADDTSAKGLDQDLSTFSLCIVPSRAEPFGYIGLRALSAGIPTLIAENSSLASLVKRLTSEPESFLVPVTPSNEAVRQDASVWRERIQGVLADPQAARARAKQLQMALRRDENTKETHDNFISYCLGGIRIKHEVMSLSFQYRKDEDKELPVMRSFNRFLGATLKQCWRYKHHPLTMDSDLYQIIPGVDLPIKELVRSVTDKIEERDRRIVGIDSESFVVYCPTPDALSDLWAMCDVINRALYATLLAGEDNAVLERMKLRAVSVRTHICGPEFLEYKNELTQSIRAEE